MANGEVSKILELEGKVIVLNFWWSDCARSAPVIPKIESKLAAEKERLDEDVIFLSVSIDPTIGKAKQHLESMNWSEMRNVWLDPENGESRAYQSYVSRTGTPVSYVIGKDGILKAAFLPEDFGTSEDPAPKFESSWERLVNSVLLEVSP